MVKTKLLLKMHSINLPIRIGVQKCNGMVVQWVSFDGLYIPIIHIRISINYFLGNLERKINKEYAKKHVCVCHTRCVMCSANDAHTCYIDFHNLDFVNVTIDITKFIFTIITNINDVSTPSPHVIKRQTRSRSRWSRSRTRRPVWDEVWMMSWSVHVTILVRHVTNYANCPSRSLSLWRYGSGSVVAVALVSSSNVSDGPARL